MGALPSDMTDARRLPLATQIDLVEQRMALRREQVAANLDATRAEARRMTRKAMHWLPLAGATGALAVGFMAARHRRKAAQAQALRFAPVAPAAQPVTRGLVATALALAAAGLRFATSSEGRLAWRAFQSARDRARRRRR